MSVTNFIWDELSENVFVETDAAGSVDATYTNEPGQFGELVSERRDGDTSFYHFDGQGSTRELTDSNETVTDQSTYSAFGEEVARSGLTVNPFGFQGSVGYYVNPYTEELYVRARHYRPSFGRWLSLDPLALVDSVNLYVYALNNPVDMSDPSGESCLAGLPPNLGEKVKQCGDLEWHPSLCKQGFPEDNCLCSQTKTGNAASQKSCDTMLDKAKQALQLCPKATLKRFICRRECVPELPGFSITCPKTVNNVLEISVCISVGNSTGCDVAAIIEHELTHVRQYIASVCGGMLPTPGATAAEEQAYTKQCTLLADQQCLTGQRRNQFITNCVNSRIGGSTSPQNKILFDTACRKLTR